MLRNLIYTLLAALIIWAVVAGIRSFFFTQPAKDRSLAANVARNMSTDNQFKDNFVDFKLLSPGNYRIDTTGLADAQSAGRFAYNSMVVLTERNDSLVVTGLNNFTIVGFQDDRKIFEVTYNYDLGAIPQVTLYGQFEGQVYVPSFSGQSSVPTPDNSEPAPPSQPGRGRREFA